MAKKNYEGKPGYKTTEFWLTVAAQIVGVLLMSGVFGDGSTGAQALGVAAQVLSALGYKVSRGMVKKGESQERALRGERGPLAKASDED